MESLPDEQSLIASCQAGHLDDFDPLYRAYVERIYAFLYRRTLDKQTAEDLTSITFMKALEKISQFSPSKGIFIAWLYRIARNSLNDHYRSHRPTTDIEDVWDLSSDEDIPNQANNRLLFKQVKEALGELEASKREIILLRLWENLSYQEIAEITGKTETNCKVIFSRTMESLRKRFPLAALFLISFPFSL